MSKIELRCSVPQEGLDFNMKWEESIIPGLGDALYLTRFLNEEDLLALKDRKRRQLWTRVYSKYWMTTFCM